MPARKRHQPGKYKPKPELLPNFSGVKPLTLFQDTNGLWGAKDGDGNIEIAPIYQRAEHAVFLRRLFFDVEQGIGARTGNLFRRDAVCFVVSQLLLPSAVGP